MVSASQNESKKLRKIVFATSAGTIFEAYDFILFGSMAPLISRHFFSGVSESAGIIFALSHRVSLVFFLVPAIAFAMVAANGNMYFGLWYPMVITVIGIIVLTLLLPETKGRDIHRLD